MRGEGGEISAVFPLQLNIQKGFIAPPADIQKGFISPPVDIQKGFISPPADIQKGIGYRVDLNYQLIKDSDIYNYS